MSDTNACGNRHIDGLAHRGRLQSIWSQLEYRYAEVRDHAEAVWVARKNGVLRRLVEREPRYAVLLDGAQTGPTSDAEWDLLAEAALVAIGRLDMQQLVTRRNAA
jgi:hypothetical protein